MSSRDMIIHLSIKASCKCTPGLGLVGASTGSGPLGWFYRLVRLAENEISGVCVLGKRPSFRH